MLFSNMSTVTMPKHIPLALMKGAWFAVRIDEAETLGELLRAQFDKHDGSANEIIQGQVAVDMGIHQGTLSKVQNDRSPGTAQRWSSKQVLTLFKGYRIDDPQEMAKAAVKFDLKFSLGLPLTSGVFHTSQNSVTEYTDIDKLTEHHVQVLGIQGVKVVAVPEFLLKSRDAGAVFILDTAGETLACPKAKELYNRHFRVFFDREQTPKPGNVLAYQVQGEETYILQVYSESPPSTPVAVTSYDERRIIVLHPGDPELEFLGTAFTSVEEDVSGVRNA